MLRRILYAGVVSALMISCGGDKEKPSTAELPTMTVERTSLELETEYAARMTGRQMVDIRPQVSGVITKICITEGDMIRKGQLLFVIDQVPYRAALEVATANVKTAESSLASAKLKLQSNNVLFAKKVISEYDLQLSKNEVAAAESELALAKARETAARNDLSYTEITSPVDGVAGMIPHHVGTLVSSSMAEPLVTVCDDGVIYAYFSLTESQVISMVNEYGSTEKFIAQAPPVRLVMSNGEMYEGEGRIDAVSGVVDAGTGAVTVRAAFGNRNHLLRNGGSGRVVLPASHDSCLVIPQSATYELQNRVFVYKVLADTCTATQVSVYKHNDGKHYIVESGLEEGDVIVASGAGLIKEGARVK
ncbi:MAG: efflux RND transporter periplasmic adaptor subunit [Bacteroidales bacterium]|nr:efflux RND transporter periplasmic adaptor subunit [Bacteroidales bacterium]